MMNKEISNASFNKIFLLKINGNEEKELECNNCKEKIKLKDIKLNVEPSENPQIFSASLPGNGEIVDCCCDNPNFD